ncbi:ornithine cyclodeaminase family protein [Burkholderia sp. WSM2232]|uniref:ornithine cyclodeaminase family protein n=1 Tax=Burkholderia sp. WSM2232 TaxID=944436 RepID=UPI000487734C|nr:ornithine cyclodeaminase family protein [Burkholderia sp. WSM2232]
MSNADKTIPLIVNEETVRNALPHLNVRAALTQMFRSLAKDTAVQPPQTLTLLPGGAGDFITYLGAMAHAQVFGAKLSPYIVTGSRPIITAWTALMSMQTGQPLMWCDAGLLTIERTAGTTALAVEQLAPPNSRTLAVIGSGAVAQAHIRHLAALKQWTTIRVFSRNLQADEAKHRQLTALDERVRTCARIEDCVQDADVIALCTSSGTPVLADGMLNKPALITSISTNATNAREIPPAWIPDMDVYCDYRQTTPASSGEMKLAAEQHGWHPRNVAGDLPELLSRTAARPAYEKHAFFRSIGLGLEDVAIAFELFRHLTTQ